MGVRILFGAVPKVPQTISAKVLRALRAPDGGLPCSEGLTKALQWIGDREIPFTQALEEAERVLSLSDLEWGRRALWISGSGYGSGYGHGYGDGDGYGNGNGHGSDNGYGNGYGSGYGSGDVYGDGFGEEI